MNALDAYHDAVRRVLDDIRGRRDILEEFATRIADAVAAGGLVYVTGSGHSHMLAEEPFYRAGGLAAVHPVLLPELMLHRGALRSSRLERLPGIAGTALADLDLSERDVMVVASNSGRNAYPVEAALIARERGAFTVAITSLRHTSQVASRHPGGKRLFEVVDLVVDNGAPYGDAAVELEGASAAVGPLSTLAGVYILNATLARATELLLARGAAPELFVSANRDGGETMSADRIAYWRSRVRPL